ncbi:conjugative transposon protein TraN [Porphyromonas gingivicanis]|uniref:conjugative transposon protein TraN n=1 Tax=Porphyromonas gingivicanis TaxID=266762 RepID=UPI00046E53CA|nr:conjugative transposon protein TraN [Porphyromonas gingivicanis]
MMQRCFTVLLQKIIALTLIFTISIVVCEAQLQKVQSIPIAVNYSQTVHLVFPVAVKYYESVSDFVVCESPSEALNILRIKANTEDFRERSNVSVATEDGLFYTFDVSYKKNLERTFYKFPKSTMPEKAIVTLEVSDASQTHIVFPKKIVYIDWGDEVVEGRRAENTENILRLQAIKKFEGKTNVSLTTEDGTFYTYNLVYKSEPEILLYRLEGVQQVILTDNRINSREKSDVIKQLKERKQKFYNLGMKRLGMVFTIKNIAIYKDALLFVVSINNKTNIPYDIDYIRYSITDKKVGKLTASQDEEKKEMFGYNHTTRRIEAKNTLNYIVAFDKFSLSDDKIFRIEINEKGGGRHIVFDIENVDIEECEQL